jgi:hypothetical protein
MKKVILTIGLILLSVVALDSCSNENATPISEDEPRIQNDMDVPNSNTRREYIQTQKNPKNDGVISLLISALKQEKFERETGNFHPNNSFYDAHEEVQFTLRGNGMNAFSFKRTEAKPENYYPDFHLSVFAFKTEREARDCETKIKDALTGGRFANGKAPHVVARNKKEVFYFTTRAEMFRGYIEDCAIWIEGY